MSTIKPSEMSGRKSIYLKIEPDIVKLFDERVIKDSKESAISTCSVSMGSFFLYKTCVN